MLTFILTTAWQYRGGISKWEGGCWLLWGGKNGKSIAHFLLFCIEILMLAEVKVDKPGRSFEPHQLERLRIAFVCKNIQQSSYLKNVTEQAGRTLTSRGRVTKSRSDAFNGVVCERISTLWTHMDPSRKRKHGQYELRENHRHSCWGASTMWRVDYICDTIFRGEHEKQWKQLGEKGWTDVHLWFCYFQMMREHL